jgi:hypothetical protein
MKTDELCMVTLYNHKRLSFAGCGIIQCIIQFDESNRTDKCKAVEDAARYETKAQSINWTRVDRDGFAGGVRQPEGRPVTSLNQLWFPDDLAGRLQLPDWTG